jgi:hypothetical protein
MQQENNRQQHLSVVIPTTARRYEIFETISSVLDQVNSFPWITIEVVINPLGNNKQIVKRLLASENIETRFHPRPFETAEASAMWAAYTSKSDWIWLIGDDDEALTGSIDHVAELIKNDEVDFWLLNLLCVFDQLPVEYYRVGPRLTQVSSSIDLWKKCGFFSTLTTISCFLIRRETLDIDLFEEFHDIQGIYSHSVSLLAMLYKSKAGMSDFFCVQRKEGNAEDILNSMQSYVVSRGIDSDYIWTRGAHDLLNHLARKIDFPIEKLLNFRELEIVKDNKNSYIRSGDVTILVGTSAAFISRFASASDKYDEYFGNDWLESQVLTPPLAFPAPVRITIQH